MDPATVLEPLLRSGPEMSPVVVETAPERVLERYRRHLSRGRALFGQVSGGLTEVASTGAWIVTASGRRLLDCGGYGVFIHGHCHPVIVRRVSDQLHRHPLATRMLLEPVTAAAAEALSRIAPDGLEHVHFVNSGAEAAETAIKLARILGHRALISTVRGFHGKTIGALSLTGNPTYSDPFLPLLDGVTHVPYGDLDAMRRALAEHGSRACVVLEPVQGEGGVVLPPAGYLSAVQAMCRTSGALLVIDEVQTGMGRTGHWWGCDREGLQPDMMLVGKGLSGGVVPIAAVLATRAAYAPFDADPFLHSSTFAGSPLASAAALAAIEVISTEGLLERATEIGERLLADLGEVLRKRLGSRLLDSRGAGLLLGFEFADAATVGELVLALLEEGVVVNTSLNQNRVLRLTPPAVFTKAHERFARQAFDRAACTVARRAA